MDQNNSNQNFQQNNQQQNQGFQQQNQGFQQQQGFAQNPQQGQFAQQNFQQPYGQPQQTVTIDAGIFASARAMIVYAMALSFLAFFLPFQYFPKFYVSSKRNQSLFYFCTNRELGFLYLFLLIPLVIIALAVIPVISKKLSALTVLSVSSMFFGCLLMVTAFMTIEYKGIISIGFIFNFLAYGFVIFMGVFSLIKDRGFDLHIATFFTGRAPGQGNPQMGNGRMM